MSKPPFKAQRFGRYLLLDHFKSGGMAEIFRARMAASDDANRLLAIKKIASTYAANEEFVKMFKSEIKVSIGLTHPNIVQIYDYGEHGSSYFLAMEYVDGKDLKTFIKRLKQLKSIFSLDISAYIIAQACSGMHYAHTFKDKMSGRPLNIIHRDLSPQNLMITFDGTVKILDFGIAKAESKVDSTRAGTIKGKLGYLAPEYINGEQLDARYDVFALGICLWELLTARRLFSAENELAVLKQIQECNIARPSQFNKAVPKELDDIVMKALAKDKNERYQSCDEMQRSLHKFLYTFNPNFNPADLANLSRELFKKEIAEDRKVLAEISNIKLEDVAPENSSGQEGGNYSKEALAMNIMSSADFNLQSMEEVNTGTSRKPVILDTSASQELGLGGGKQDGTTSSRGPITLRTKIEDTSLKAKKRSNGALYLVKAGIAVASFAFVGIALDRFIPCSIKTSYGLDFLNSCKTLSTQVTVDGPPPGSVIYVNGQKIVPTEYPYKIESIPIGKTLLLEVESKGYTSEKREIKVGEFGEYVQFVLKPEQDFEQSRAVSSVTAGFGILNLKSNLPAEVSLVRENGNTEVIGMTPITDFKLPVGKYTLKLENQLLSKSKTVQIEVFKNRKVEENISLLD